MKVPLSWLREFAPVEQGPEELADILTSRGLKVEGIDRPWQGLDGVVVARVVEKRPHPNSDRLTLATLDAGGTVGHVAAGVANWEVGDLVPYAPPGSRVPVLAEPLQTRTLRGEPSEGMICSPRELAISADHGGILILPADAPVGAHVKELFGLDQVVFDIEIKANRPDLLSMVGVAREAAAATGVPLSLPDVSVEEADPPATGEATVRIADLDRCPRYLARVIQGVTMGPSPLWVQGRLAVAGMRPISNIVDATNYVMLEMGQPLHAFDMARLAGPGIVVRRADEGERMVTLDGVERVLSADDLVIADLERGVAIAGVMGSSTAEVSDDTTDIVLESAHFARHGVIRTSRRLDLRTEASNRFERGTDPEGVPRAAARAASRIVAWAGGTVRHGVVEAGGPPPRRRLTIRPDRAARVLGLPVSTSEVVGSLARIGVAAEPRDGVVEVEVPSWRVDLEREVDLIEDVIRVEGYDRVEESRPAVRQAGSIPATTVARRRVRATLVHAGLRETKSYSFASSADLELTCHDQARAVPVRNPLSPDEGYLRPSLLPGLFRAIRMNAAHQARTVALFEVGDVFELAADPDAPIDEREHVAAVFAGAPDTGLRADGRPFDFFDAKGAVEALMEAFAIERWDLTRIAHGANPSGVPAYLHPTRSATVVVDGAAVGIVGELEPRVAERFDAGGPVAVLELDVDALRSTTGAFAFRAPPRFPPVRRDLAFVVDAGVPVARIEAGIELAGAPLVGPGSAELFDVFEGAPLPDGKKNVAFSVAFRASDRTLTDPEVTDAVGRIAAWVEANAGGELRAG